MDVHFNKHTARDRYILEPLNVCVGIDGVGGMGGIKGIGRIRGLVGIIYRVEVVVGIGSKGINIRDGRKTCCCSGDS